MEQLKKAVRKSVTGRKMSDQFYVDGDVNVADENSLIALSTCSEAETNGRVVLIGKLEREVAEKQ